MTATVVERFWAEHQVGGPYNTLEASEDALTKRAELYPTLESLMPTVFPDQTVLDYGCGPGHDTILFLKSGARLVYYADVSPLAIATTARRLRLYGFDAGRAVPLPVSGYKPVLPRVDHAHCAGVLHHVDRPLRVLSRLQRSLRPDAELRLMVYDGDDSEHSQSEVPVTRWWTHEQVTGLARFAGLDAEYVGGYPCPAEWRPDCDAACYRMTPL